MSRVQSFMSMFVDSWDKHSTVYKQYEMRITRKFSGIEFMLGNAFLANEFRNSRI